jgi:hypothetical protein
MSTVSVPREVTSQEVVDALRNNLDPRYDVLPGKRMRRSPLFGGPEPGEPGMIVVTGGRMTQAQVTILSRGGRTELRVTPGGLLGDLVMNTFGVAREVRQALLNAPSLNTSGPSQ